MRTRIEGYRNFPGEHCGSVAMRGLLHHYCGLELPEPVVFGLGAGLDCVYFASPGMSPSAVAFGRTLTMEADLAQTLGVAYSEQPDADDARAWHEVREEVREGRPTMLSGDIFYLDYREYKVHFPGHRFVLLGFDDEREVAFIADRLREEPEECSYAALFASRNPPEGLSSQNLWGRFSSGVVEHDPTEACRTALDLCASRMLEERDLAAGFEASGTTAVGGIAGIRRLAAELPGWGERSDVADLASYNASCIEKFGNGGGNFRRLYADFLEWARGRDPERVPADAPELSRAAADDWTGLAQLLWKAAEGGDTWAEAARLVGRIADTEQQLFERLAPR